jgi:hypothetical protein
MKARFRGETSNMRLERRVEKRIVEEVPVRQVIGEELFVAEQAHTVNVGPRGARLATKRKWRAGERARVAAGLGEFEVHARIVYCEEQAGGQFYVGLEFQTIGFDGDDGGRKKTPARAA